MLATGSMIVIVALDDTSALPFRTILLGNVDWPVKKLQVAVCETGIATRR